MNYSSLVALFDNIAADLERLGILSPSSVEAFKAYIKDKICQWSIGLEGYAAFMLL